LTFGAIQLTGDSRDARSSPRPGTYRRPRCSRWETVRAATPPSPGSLESGASARPYHNWGRRRGQHCRRVQPAPASPPRFRRIAGTRWVVRNLLFLAPARTHGTQPVNGALVRAPRRLEGAGDDSAACSLRLTTTARKHGRHMRKDWGTRWRKGRLLRKQLLSAAIVYGTLLGVGLWWTLL
jgi:hypothetical protein